MRHVDVGRSRQRAADAIEKLVTTLLLDLVLWSVIYGSCGCKSRWSNQKYMLLWGAWYHEGGRLYMGCSMKCVLALDDAYEEAKATMEVGMWTWSCRAKQAECAKPKWMEACGEDGK